MIPRSAATRSTPPRLAVTTSAATETPAHPDAVDFVRFCYRRRQVGWPELYDEMCAVAHRGAFRGCGPDELAVIGIGLALFDMPRLAALATRVVAEEQELRRPVAVVLTVAVEEPVVPVAVEEPIAPVAAEAPVPSVAEATTRPEVHPVTTEDRIEVPIRLATAPAGA